MLNKMINRWCNKIISQRDPDVVIGDVANPYLLRWWILPRNRFFNLYLHRVLRSDDDRALHDHPWVNLSYIVEGRYNEVTASKVFPGAYVRTVREAGTFKFRNATAQHRLELIDGNACTTLFFTGPRLRQWGFQCPNGWVHWRDFTRHKPDGSFVSAGCGDIDPRLLHKTPAKSGWRFLTSEQV